MTNSSSILHPSSFVGDTGDQTSGMIEGYIAAATRIEIEIGVPRGLCLDVGCNTGVGMRALADRWPDTTWWGLEPSEKQAAIAREAGCRVTISAAEALWLPARTFDFVFTRHSLEHCRDRAMAIDQLARVLKPGGFFYIQAPIEPGGTKNPLHLSPFLSLDDLRWAFALSGVPGRTLALDLHPFRERYCGPQETVAELIMEKL